MTRIENWDIILEHNNWPNWQDEISIKNISMLDYRDLVEWLYNFIPNTEDNVCWTFAYEPVLRFRNERDKILFLLRWS